MKNIITKKYDDIVVFDHFTFEIIKGRFTALVGESGAGKTTLLRILAGVETCEGVYEEFSSVAFLYQESVFIEHLSLGDNLALAGIKNAKKEAEKLGLKDAYDRPISSYSGGMKRRASILRAALFDASIYLLDEPLKELDVENYDRCVRFLKEKLSGKTVVFSTHREREIDLFNAIILPLAPDYKDAFTEKCGTMNK